ncbi:hypothetical protein C8R43DRAFT_1119550 [Mycena crocata]|nr:hypothetical protein C8R43DRAFT_1119550 [Mycena crocata]
MASKEFVIGVPNRIWWDAGKTAGNVTFRVTTLGAGRHTAWDTRTSVISIPDITEVEGQGVGFDWHPSIEPWASFVITLGDDRGIGSGGSLRGTAASPAFLCAYQMSGTYPVLQRLLLYILFLLGTIGLFTASGWLTGPFLGGAMAYAGSAAIHSIIILASSNKSSQKGTIDLDAIPIFQILSVCLYLCAPLLLGSYTLRKHTGETSATVVVVSVWAVLIIVGFFCSLLVEGPAAIAPCAPYNATLPDGTYRTVPTDAGLCAEMCAIKSSLIREVGEAEMLDSTITLHGVFGGLWELGFFVGIACAIGVTSITIVTIFAPNAGGGALTAMMELGGTSTTRSTRPRARRSRRVKKGDSGPACLVFFILVAAPIALVIQLALGEHRLAKAALVSEKSYAVGQWGPWVMVGLALVSSVFFLLTSSTRYGAEPIPEDAPIPPDESTRT